MKTATDNAKNIIGGLDDLIQPSASRSDHKITEIVAGASALE